MTSLTLDEIPDESIVFLDANIQVRNIASADKGFERAGGIQLFFPADIKLG